MAKTLAEAKAEILLETHGEIKAKALVYTLTDTLAEA